MDLKERYVSGPVADGTRYWYCRWSLTNPADTQIDCYRSHLPHSYGVVLLDRVNLCLSDAAGGCLGLNIKPALYPTSSAGQILLQWWVSDGNPLRACMDWEFGELPIAEYAAQDEFLAFLTDANFTPVDPAVCAWGKVVPAQRMQEPEKRVLIPKRRWALE